MIGWLVRAVLSPFLRLGEKYLDNQKDARRLDAAVSARSAVCVTAARKVKLGYLLGRIPLFVAELSAALYFAAVMIDSTFPMQWLTPLELPAWFQPHFHWALASIFGLSWAARRWPGR